jgi:hypothetical protein
MTFTCPFLCTQRLFTDARISQQLVDTTTKMLSKTSPSRQLGGGIEVSRILVLKIAANSMRENNSAFLFLDPTSQDMVHWSHTLPYCYNI